MQSAVALELSPAVFWAANYRSWTLRNALTGIAGNELQVWATSGFYLLAGRRQLASMLSAAQIPGKLVIKLRGKLEIAPWALVAL
jgi:hypothetical protein